MSWDDIGLEALINLSEIEQDFVHRALTEGRAHDGRPRILMSLEMRARLNSHRHYEIYVAEIDDSITEERLRDYWELNPQGFKELMRSRAKRFY